MPRPRTRGVFLEHQRDLRGHQNLTRAIELAIEQEWAGKNAAEKAAIVAAINQVNETKVDVRLQQGHVTNASGHFRHQQNAATLDFAAFYAACDNALHQYRALRQLLTNLAQAWNNLQNVERAQVGPVHQSLAHSIAEEIQARTDAITATGSIAQLRVDRNKPPVPLDENGRRRLPVLRYQGNNRSLLNARARHRGLRADRLAGRVGLRHPGNGRSRVQQAFNMNLSIGTLWLQTDDNDYIIDRVFRKEVYSDEHQWRDPRWWEGDMRNPNSKTPNELACHSSVLGISTRNFVGMREGVHRGLIDNDACSYKLYLEWCQHGDLEALLSRHIANNWAVPEAMIWCVAEALGRCGLVMEKGPAYRGMNQDTDWEPIVHRDFKPGNVFLAAPDPLRYPSYPKPMLGDFGLAFKTTPDDPNNPRWYNYGSGTPGFYAPEQTRWIDNDTLAPISEWKLGEKTNVYGVGLVLWCLLNRNNDPRQPDWLGIGANDTTLNSPDDPSPISRGVRHYSKALRKLVQDCLSFAPENRPTFGEILASVVRETDEGLGSANLTRGMRSGNASVATKAQTELPYDLVDEYRLGLVAMP